MSSLSSPDVIYCGNRFEGRVMRRELPSGDVTVLDPGPSLQVWNHSPTGFEWGYGGSGPAQLALALLLDVTGNATLARRFHQAFKWRYVARWGDDWVITAAEIERWLGEGL